VKGEINTIESNIPWRKMVSLNKFHKVMGFLKQDEGFLYNYVNAPKYFAIIDHHFETNSSAGSTRYSFRRCLWGLSRFECSC